METRPFSPLLLGPGNEAIFDPTHKIEPKVGVGTLSQLNGSYMQTYTEVKCMDELCMTQATQMTSSVAGQCLPYKILIVQFSGGTFLCSDGKLLVLILFL